MLRAAMISLVLFACCGASRASERVSRSDLDGLIETHARRHGVPLTLMRRVVQRESGFNPGLVHRGNFGLMQIKYPTARGMGYSGAPRGLLDPNVNLTYATPYLANAYRLANGSEDRAVSLYASGFYYVAKRNRLLGSMRTDSSAPFADPEKLAAPPPPPPSDPITSALNALFQ